MTDSGIHSTGIPGITTLGKMDDITVVRFGVRTSPRRDPAILWLADHAEEGLGRQYRLHWFTGGVDTTYDCEDSGYSDADGYRIFVIRATSDDTVTPPAVSAAVVDFGQPASVFTLYVGPDDDPRMRITDAGETDWVDDIGFEYFSIGQTGAGLIIKEETKPVPVIWVDRLQRTIHRFIATNGDHAHYESLSDQLARIIRQEAGRAGSTVDMPLWIVSWLQRLLSICQQTVGPEHLHSVALRVRVTAPMVKILSIIERLKAASFK